MGAVSDARVALLYPGDRAARDRSDPAESRFAALFEALAAAGIAAEPAVWHDDFADEVAAQLRRVGLVLAWCNPIEGGRTRARLDAVLRDAAAAGAVVSAHPDTILRLGTKDVLVDTRALPFGSDAVRVDSLEALRDGLPQRLALGPRVLKQHRGHSGIGVWRVERADDAGSRLRLRHAQRGSVEEEVDWPGLLARMAPYFDAAAGAHLIDQPWQPRIADGMVRAYLVGDRVAGFGLQAVNALHPTEAQPGPRLYHGPDLAGVQSLRQRLESSWVRLLCDSTGVPPAQLPLLWDVDFMHGESAAGAEPRWVLCEINVSSVAPFPPSAVAPLVQAVRQRLAG